MSRKKQSEKSIIFKYTLGIIEGVCLMLTGLYIAISSDAIWALWLILPGIKIIVTSCGEADTSPHSTSGDKDPI